jgi:hypothetical protein
MVMVLNYRTSWNQSADAFSKLEELLFSDSHALSADDYEEDEDENQLALKQESSLDSLEVGQLHF